jgi:hypothetical protein
MILNQNKIMNAAESGVYVPGMWSAGKNHFQKT